MPSLSSRTERSLALSSPFPNKYGKSYTVEEMAWQNQLTSGSGGVGWGQRHTGEVTELREVADRAVTFSESCVNCHCDTHTQMRALLLEPCHQFVNSGLRRDAGWEGKGNLTLSHDRPAFLVVKKVQWLYSAAISWSHRKSSVNTMRGPDMTM